MDPSQTLHGLVMRSAADRPDHVAVIDPQRDAKITYGDLDRITDEIAESLRAIGVGEGDRVGVYIPKSVPSFASVFGILKAGAAYIPVDPKAPPSRNAFIFKDCQVKAMLVAEPLADGLRAEFNGQPIGDARRVDALSEYGVDVALIPAGAYEETVDQAVPDRLAYILYTSGSTGKPKGVMHTHDSALSFVDWCSRSFEPNGDDVFSSHAPFHFDLSILDIYLPMMHGATVVLIGEDLGKQPQRLAEVIETYRLTMWYSTPSILRLLVEYGDLEHRDCSSLRVVHFAGEVFPIKHLRALVDVWPHPTYYNLYGPTETNVCTAYRIPDVIPEDREVPFPIGPTCDNDRSLVMDMDDRPVDRGAEGELYIAGGSVMQGYWNLPERTANAFYVHSDGDRYYKTGDVVVETEEDGYVFVGRRDRMVKKRGYRVELGEIESALYRHATVAEAAVVALTDDDGGVLIKAFVAFQDGEKGSMIAMKQHCAKHLPLYMVPDRFSFHASLPKTSTDKVDYQGLKQLD